MRRSDHPKRDLQPHASPLAGSAVAGPRPCSPALPERESTAGPEAAVSIGAAMAAALATAPTLQHLRTSARSVAVPVSPASVSTRTAARRQRRGSERPAAAATGSGASSSGSGSDSGSLNFRASVSLNVAASEFAKGEAGKGVWGSGMGCDGHGGCRHVCCALCTCPKHVSDFQLIPAPATPCHWPGLEEGADADELVAQQLGAASPGQLSEVQGQYREAIKKKLEEVGLGLMFQCGGRPLTGPAVMVHALQTAAGAQHTADLPALIALPRWRFTCSCSQHGRMPADCCPPASSCPAACRGAAARKGGQGGPV